MYVLLCYALFGAQKALAIGNGGQDTELDEFRSQLAKAQLTLAEQNLHTYLEKHPDSAEALYLLGEVAMRRNRAAESLKWSTQAAALRPPTGEQLRVVGLDYVLLDDNADALKWLRKAVELSPKDAEIWYSLGRTEYSAGAFQRAEAAFRKALVFNPNSSKVENNLGLALAAQNQPDQALEAYARAIEWQKNEAVPSEQPFLNYGMALLHRGRTEEAADFLLRACATSPTCATCHEYAGKALASLDRVMAAQEELEKAVALEPKNPRFHFELARVYRRLGKTEQGDAELKQSETLYGTHATPP